MKMKSFNIEDIKNKNREILNSTNKIRIISNDSFNEKTNNIYPLEINETKNGIKYSYSDEFGDANIYCFYENNTINKIHIIRSGQIKTKQIFKLNELTIFSYQTPYLRNKFFLETKNILIDETENNNLKTIKIKYRILDITTKEKINEIELSLQIL